MNDMHQMDEKWDYSIYVENINKLIMWAEIIEFFFVVCQIAF